MRIRARLGASAERSMRTAVAPEAVALTFDDGPSPVWTEQILAVLERHGATATFFVGGRAVEMHPELVEATVEGGHEVALHCFDHVRHSAMAPGAIRADVEAGLAALDRHGVSPAAWRTPWGDTSRATESIAAEFGLELWLWSDDSHDWRGDGCERMLRAIVPTGPRGGMVVLMHDGLGPGARREGCEQTVCLTDALLSLASAEGLDSTSVSGSVPGSGG
jgi:peptidoglycan/xylan/chitin deacetylase (PgdA/CDA1 family)